MSFYWKLKVFSFWLGKIDVIVNMGDFVLDGKSKVKRIFPAVEEKLNETGRISLVGVGNGAVKAVAIAEKLKQKLGSLTQVNEISEKDSQAVITIILTMPESQNMDLRTQ